MKCIIRQYGLGGGAPRSLLQHIDALSSLSYDHFECLTHNTDTQLLSVLEKKVDKVILRLSPLELWRNKKFFQSFREYIWEYKYIKKTKPDLSIALGQFNGALYSWISRKLGIPLIIYIAGGTLAADDPAVQCWRDCDVICFSKENADAITCSFPSQNTHVISNRISISESFDDLENHYQCQKSAIKILLVSRLDSDKINSIYSVLNVLSGIVMDDLRVEVRIAGNGSCRDALSEYVAKIQSDHLHVQMLGQIQNLTEEFRWAHIVAGKGRSVIEPIMMHRIGCVVGEDGKIEFCCKDNFDNLYHYNFSGRNLEKDDPQSEMSSMITKIRDGLTDAEEVKEIAQLTQTYYSADYLPQQLSEALGRMNMNTPAKRWLPLWYGFFRLMVKSFSKRIKGMIFRCRKNTL